jgi:arylsulfatase A-like enzyme
VQAADIAPTVLELAGLPVTEGAGRSFAPALRGEPYTGREAVYTSYRSLPTKGRISYLRCCITVTEPELTLVVGPDGRPPELYDRRPDPDCLKNIAETRPTEVRRMKEELIAFMQAQGAPERYISEYVV